MAQISNTPLRLAIPKGHMESRVLELLADAGIAVTPTVRSYRPRVTLPDVDAKFLKPQNIVEMLAVGRRDVGFAGADWVAEFGVDLVEVLDTGLDPVMVAAGCPPELLTDGALPTRELLVASEYECLARTWSRERGLRATVIRSYGATEVFPPEDADLIIDNTATGATFEANRLVVCDTLMASSTRLYASRAAWRDAAVRERVEGLALLLASVLEARRRVMVEVNVTGDRLDAVVDALPCMRQATVAPLYGNGAFAVRAAVPRESLPHVIPAVKAAGATDVVVSRLAQIVP